MNVEQESLDRHTRDRAFEFARITQQDPSETTEQMIERARKIEQFLRGEK